MEDINIKCNNVKESKIVKNYLINAGYIWYDSSKTFKEYKEKFPIVIYNSKISNPHLFCMVYDDFNICSYKIIEAKHIIRKEKLKRINNGKF